MAERRAQTAPSRRAPGEGLRSALVAAGLATTLGLLAAIAIWTWDGGDQRLGTDSAATALSGDEAELAALRLASGFRDVQAVWRADFRHRLGQAYRPPRLLLFTSTTPSPCAGAGGAAGPFYCAANLTAAFDLAVVDSLGFRLRRQADRGTAILVARVVAEHVLIELDRPGDLARAAPEADPAERRARDLALALEADCLAGVWAHLAAPRLGAVPENLYSRLIESMRSAVRERGRPAGAVAGLVDLGRLEDRAAAFHAGLGSGDPAGCLRDVPAG